MKTHQKIAKLISEVWENKDFDLLEANLSDNVQWYEGSYSDPLHTHRAVIGQWKKDLSTQKDINSPVEVIMANGQEGFYHCRASWIEDAQGQRELDGIFHIRLDSDGKIEYFNSWWTEKSE